jgi:hypothetical protein
LSGGDEGGRVAHATTVGARLVLLDARHRARPRSAARAGVLGRLRVADAAEVCEEGVCHCDYCIRTTMLVVSAVPSNVV